MTSDLDIMLRHVEALFTHDERGRICRINEPNGAEAPRFFLGRTASGNIWRFRYDLPDTLTERLEAFCHLEPASEDPSREPIHLTDYLRLLETNSTGQDVELGPAYVFHDISKPQRTEAVLVTEENADVLNGGFEAWIPDILLSPPLMAILCEGHAVSICGSVRITPLAYEAGVETLADYRGRGYAGDVVAKWADEVRRLGRTPLYSTSWKNMASQQVAKKLGLRKYGVDFHVK